MDINFNFKLDPAMLSLVKQVFGLLSIISDKETEIMATLQDIVDGIALETTAVGGLSVFVKGLQDQIKALAGITPAQQAQIDGIFASIEANKAVITAAMAPSVVTPVPVILP